MDRNESLLRGLDRASAKLIEIGPSFSPIAPKHQGWNTTIVDHTDREGLVAKYSQFPGIDTTQIEDVDVVWAGGELDRVVSPEKLGGFDAIIASHVIEHIVDPVAFFESASKILAPGGRILLAVPDKRLCFDCLRPVSTTGQFIAAARAKRRRHTVAALFDALAYDARPAGGTPSWARGERVDLVEVGALENVVPLLGTYHDGEAGPYYDVHGWVFTPASFATIMLELEVLGHLKWRLAEVIEQPAVEFLAIFERVAGAPLSATEVAARRRSLLLRQLEEAREQADWMLGPATFAAPEIRPPRSGSLSERAEALQARVISLRERTRTWTIG